MSIFPMYFWAKKWPSRGSTSQMSSGLVFMFLESVKHVEGGQLACKLKIKLLFFLPPPNVYKQSNYNRRQ